MPNLPIIAYALPFFFALMGVEWWANARLRLPNYRFEDWVSNLGLGMGQQAFAPLFKLMELWVYQALASRVALVHVGHSVWGWLAVILAMDFSYYWFHRLSHRIAALWAVHGVHHQSEDYNLGVALRQAWFEPVISMPFRWPWALLGFPVDMVVIGQAVITVYQFWVHIRCVRSLGPLEAVLVTPAHHRVHHGVNPEYIDKNYSGLLIVWDRMFGTFTPEVAPPVFGTVKPLNSWQPLWANSSGFVGLGRLGRHWWREPGWQPGGTPPIEVDLLRQPWSRGAVKNRLGVWLWFVSTAGLAVYYIACRAQWSVSWQIVAGALLIASVSGIGWVLDPPQRTARLDPHPTAL